MGKYKQYMDENQQNLYKKFPSTHYLSNPQNVENVLAWATFWRRNLHLFVRDYLQIPLYPYQQIAMYYMGISDLITIIASRNAAKSFLIALYGCCRCILYPGTKFRIGSKRKRQARLMVEEKIIGEFCRWSPALKKEIEKYTITANEISVEFKNGSKITVFIANDDARGDRSNVVVREEFRQIDKKVDDSVISPFQTIRNQPYMLNPFYGENPVLQENPVDVYISSSWLDDGHWLWDIVDQTYEEMVKGNPAILLAFDESITLKHHLKTLSQLKKEKKKQDPLTWKIEYLNLRIKDSLSAYFTYSMLMGRQVLKHFFMPRNLLDYKSKKRNKYFIPYQDGEFRVISNDIAFVAGEKNDNSVYSCIRAIPESSFFEGDNGSVEVQQGYRRQYPYIESNQIGDTTKQAIRIRQLYEDFAKGEECYIVIDCRNGGTQIVYALQKVLYDEERGVEYEPLKCMNNDEYAKLCQDPSAKPCIFAINATQNLNSDIAIAFRKNLIEGKIDFLTNFDTAKEEILSANEDYINETDVDQQFEYERPFLETQAMVTECAELQYEKLPQTNAIKIYEKGNNRKDRYTSVSYGSWFIDLMELDQLGHKSDFDYAVFVN